LSEYSEASGLVICMFSHFVKKILQVFYTVDKPSNNWRGGVGYVSKEMAVKGLPSPSSDSLILVRFLLLFLNSFCSLLYKLFRQGNCNG
jgi:hypothetical protein